MKTGPLELYYGWPLWVRFIAQNVGEFMRDKARTSSKSEIDDVNLGITSIFERYGAVLSTKYRAMDVSDNYCHFVFLAMTINNIGRLVLNKY
jgi:hypothetical protein